MEGEETLELIAGDPDRISDRIEDDLAQDPLMAGGILVGDRGDAVEINL